MNNFLENYKALKTPEQRERFFIEIQAHVEAYAKFSDQLKKLHHVWHKETNDLCILRDLVIQDRKENK